MKNSSESANRPNSAEARRHRILEWMQGQGAPIFGGELAKHFRISRQCLVQDMAILRASGQEILATPRGYQLPRGTNQRHRAILACRHEPERTGEELQILVDHGVKILDVIVEHPIYGEVRASLMIESRTDVEEFLQQVIAKKATLLSSLTKGIHLHTVEASRPEMITR